MLRLRNFILPSLIAFAIGAVVGAYIYMPLIAGVVVGVCALIMLPRALGGNFPLLSILLVALLAGALGIFRGATVAESFMLTQLHRQVNARVTLTGVISREPEFREGVQRLTVREDGENRMQFLASVPGLPIIPYGARVRISGVLRSPEDFESNTGAIFRYKDFLHARGVMYAVSGGRAEVLALNQGNPIVQHLLLFKQKIKEICDRLPTPEGGLMMGMIFGGKNGLPTSVQDDFRIAGIIHIVVLSGENLTIIALLIVWLIRKYLGFYSGIIVSAVVVILYAVIGGMEPATMRALAIVLLGFIAVLLRREVNLSRILLIGGAVLVSHNPLLLFDDPSFQLSMLAMLGLIFLGPIIERSLLIHGAPLVLTSYLAPILAAQLGVLPFIIFSTQSIALYALLSNILVLCFIAFLSIGGIVVVAVGWVVPSVFPIVAFPISFALSSVLAIAHGIARLPYALIPFHVSGWFIFGIYGMMVIWILRRHFDGTLTPLARYALREEVRQLAQRKIPWAPPIPDSQGIQLDYTAFAFAPLPRGKKEEEKIIRWDD